MKTALILTLACLATLSRANNITYQASFLGTTPPNGASFSSTGGDLVYKVKGNVPILGVKGGGGGAEISHTQSITVSLDNPTAIGHLQVGLLFAGETAVFTVNSDTYTLTAFDGGAHYSMDGTWLYDLAGDNGPLQSTYGMFTIDDPFGGQALTSFTLGAAKKSTYGLMSFNTATPTVFASSGVPDSGSTVCLLAAAFLGMALLFPLHKWA